MKKGFTLAEVLITLGVIGVVAALTIPTLVQNHQKKVYAIQAKKTYVEVLQVLQNIIRESGGDDLNQADFCADGNHASASRFLKENFKIVKDCGINQSGCFADKYKSYKKGHVYDSWIRNQQPSGYKVVLASGASLSLYCYNNNNKNSPKGSIYIDTNGVKGPNTGGRDFFRIYIYPEGILDGYGMNYNARRSINGHSGYSNRNYNFNAFCANPNDTDGCLDRLINNNWEMDY